jgi:hypothetical protein
VLALAQPAEGRIVYHHAHRVIGPNGKYSLDLNHDGITDFTLSASTFKTFVARAGEIGTPLSLRKRRVGRLVGFYCWATTFLLQLRILRFGLQLMRRILTDWARGQRRLRDVADARLELEDSE